MLADYAVRVEESRGRRYPEPRHPYRNDFQRDRDRVIHARAFRRLEAKTQVFTRRYCDHFRNRLTHTLEVAQIARTVALELGLNADLVEALALVHDVGHPPFGHVGEKALDAAMREHGFSFNHNLHALRIVEDFELRYAAFRGLNLTFEVREGIIKHSADYSSREFPHLAEYLLDCRPPLEAQLIDLADEIAYTTADLDDGYESRLLDGDDIRARIEIFAGPYQEAENTWPSAVDKLKFNEALRRTLDRLVSDLIRQSRANLEAAGIATLEQVRTYPKRLLGFSPEVESQRRQAKAFLYEKLYSSSALDSEKRDGERVIGELFEFWMERPENLPPSYQEKAGSEPLSRVVCDYIAGMTDNYIYQQYEKHCAAKYAKLEK
ncbi:MAG TPA: deoxyguanosinetriphosphate triphosphohydrolase [Terriglobales bacterium]|nr:deoxyguanosinetriphosphate triphosphohydrolase [Terriglobales bacterium]